MKTSTLQHHWHQQKKSPVWKGILVILLVIALPAFFSYYRNVGIQQALSNEPPIPPIQIKMDQPQLKYKSQTLVPSNNN